MQELKLWIDWVWQVVLLACFALAVYECFDIKKKSTVVAIVVLMAVVGSQAYMIKTQAAVIDIAIKNLCLEADRLSGERNLGQACAGVDQ